MNSRLALVFCVSLTLSAQLTTGIVEGILRDSQGNPVSSGSIAVTGGAGFRLTIHTDAEGKFIVILPYGNFRFSGVPVYVAPLRTSHIDLGETQQGVAVYPGAFSLTAILLAHEPSSVTEPLDFTGISDNRLAVESQGGISWTATRFTLQGIDATDSYQPGLPLILPNIEAMQDIVVSRNPSDNAETDVGLFLSEADTTWHAKLSSMNTGSALSSTSLPAADRGFLEQREYFNRMTRDGLDIGGPIGKRADVFLSSWGQWSSQTEPLQAPGNNDRSRLLFANARGRIHITDRDQFEALYSGSRIDLSNGGSPAGLEALTGNRMAPSFTLPGGFFSQPEVDHLDFVQAGWTHEFAAGVLQVRYGYSTAHLDSLMSSGQSNTELLAGAVTGAPPLGNFAIRTRQSIQTGWQRATAHHRITAGGGFTASSARNRFSAPAGGDLITVNGVPAFTLDFNAPADTTEPIRTFSAYAADHMTLVRGLSLDLGGLLETWRGSNLIAWNSVSPRAGLEWSIPYSHGLVLLASYSRFYSPLAGRYLDFGNPDGLSGEEYNEQGTLLMRFGGAYSSISPSLRQPYSNRIDVGAEAPLTRRASAAIHLFRVDTKDRIAALDVGVPNQDYSPVTVIDPGDDQPLTVYAQNPATLGQDRYLLTNPAGLEMQNTGFVAEAKTQWHSLTVNTSFVGEKSYGPTNPGNGLFENDPGVVGSLLLDPNTAINAANRSFVDRAYVGKIYGTYRLPWGGIELAGVADYLDGLPFARELLVTGLPQGPFLVDATVRGSPEGGNRAEHVMNANLGIRREFKLRFGSITGLAQIMNVTNAAHKIQESDITSPAFNLRLPVALQPPRSIDLGFRYTF